MKLKNLKPAILTLSIIISFNANARFVIEEDSEVQRFDHEYIKYKEKVKNNQYAASYEQNLEIQSLKREIASTANSLTARTKYLEEELAKTKEILIDTAIAANKKEDYYNNTYKKELDKLKEELVLKNKILAEYQREVEKLKSDREYKELAKQNFELASQLRNYNQKTTEDSRTETNKRMPASVNP